MILLKKYISSYIKEYIFVNGYLLFFFFRVITKVSGYEVYDFYFIISKNEYCLYYVQLQRYLYPNVYLIRL